MGDARSFSDLSLLNLTILGATIGKSRSLFAYRTSKGVMLIKSTDALIQFLIISKLFIHFSLVIVFIISFSFTLFTPKSVLIAFIRISI